MQRKATVDRVLPGGKAELLVVRESACSGDCHHCGGCGAVQQTLRLTADNPIEAKRGDVVVIESQSTPVLWAAALIYLLPLLFFLGGYLGAMALEGRPIVFGSWGFLLGVLPAFAYNRRMKKKPPTYTIVDFVL